MSFVNTRFDCRHNPFRRSSTVGSMLVKKYIYYTNDCQLNTKIVFIFG